MRALEYKNHANSEGNRVLPYFISREVNGAFPFEHKMIGLPLGDDIYIPNEIVQLDRAALIERNRNIGMKKPGAKGKLINMKQSECDEATIAWCDANGIE